jgi:gliding motility-associated-like protein
MKKIFSVLLLFLFITTVSLGQTIYWSETFDAPAGGANNNNAGVGWPSTGVPTPGGGPNGNFLGISNNWSIGNSGLCVAGNNLYITPTGIGTNTYLSDIETDKLMSSPTISNSGVTAISIKFTYRCNGVAGSDFGQLGFSNDGGTSWNWLATQYAGVSNCTQVTVPVPAIYDNIGNFKFAFRFISVATSCASCDPPFNIDNIELSGNVAGAATITTSALPNATVCAGATFNVPFTTTGTFNAGNQFTAQLSDASGSFAFPTNIGSATTSPVSVTIPGGTPPGSGYLIRIVSSNPVVTGTASVTTLTVNASQALAVSLTADATSVCPGATVNFTATPGQTLTNATYAWTVGGFPQAGQTTSTLSAPINTNNTIVQVTLTTTDACFSPATATANVTISTAGQALTVSVIASDDTICAGDNVTFAATTSPAVLTNATYTWFIGPTQAQTGASPTFSSSSLTGLNSITVTVSSTDVCLSNTSATSPPVLVLQQSTPLVANITVFPNNNPCPGAPLTFTANVAPANVSGLTYQWKINGNDVAGQVLSTFNTTTYADGDVITVVVTSNDPCVTGSPETSNIITITFSSGQEASVTATASQLEVCSGTPVTFTASPVNGGVTPVYTWLVNGVPTGGSGPVFTSAGLVGGATVQVVMQSSETCVSNNPDTADVTITVIQSVQPTAVLNESIKLCSNSAGRIIATVSPSGGTLKWTVNDLPNTVIGSFYTDLSNVGDEIRLYYVDIPGCVFVDSLASNSIVVQLYNAPIVDLGEDLTITYGDEVQLNASITPNNSIYSWTPSNYLNCTPLVTNCLNPFANPTDTSNLLVLVAADPITGCTNSDSIIIYVKTNYDIFIPTAFSPNGDGNNDVLYVRNPPKQFKPGEFLFRIYNEYGEKIFETEYKEFGWDGKYRDKFALPGVYMYHLTGLYADDKPIDQKGKFLLMK